MEWNGNHHNLFFWLSLSGEFLEEIIFKLIISETFSGVIFWCWIDKLTFLWSKGCGDSKQNLSGGGGWGLSGGHPWEATDTLVQGQIITVIVNGRSKVSPTFRLNICKARIKWMIYTKQLFYRQSKNETQSIPAQVSF